MTDEELIEVMARGMWSLFEDEVTWSEALADERPIAKSQVEWQRNEARAALSALREAGYEVRRKG